MGTFAFIFCEIINHAQIRSISQYFIQYFHNRPEGRTLNDINDGEFVNVDTGCLEEKKKHINVSFQCYFWYLETLQQIAKQSKYDGFNVINKDYSWLKQEKHEQFLWLRDVQTSLT